MPLAEAPAVGKGVHKAALRAVDGGENEDPNREAAVPLNREKLQFEVSSPKALKLRSNSGAAAAAAAVAAESQRLADLARAMEEREMDLEVLDMRLQDRAQALALREAEATEREAELQTREEQDEAARQAREEHCRQFVEAEQLLTERAGRLAAREKRLAEDESSCLERQRGLAVREAELEETRRRLEEVKAELEAQLEALTLREEAARQALPVPSRATLAAPVPAPAASRPPALVLAPPPATPPPALPAWPPAPVGPEGPAPQSPLRPAACVGPGEELTLPMLTFSERPTAAGSHCGHGGAASSAKVVRFQEAPRAPAPSMEARGHGFAVGSLPSGSQPQYDVPPTLGPVPSHCVGTAGIAPVASPGSVSDPSLELHELGTDAAALASMEGHGSSLRRRLTARKRVGSAASLTMPPPHSDASVELGPCMLDSQFRHSCTPPGMSPPPRCFPGEVPARLGG